jgi:multidrug transporter EmrE-like cation transporter
VDKLPYLLLLLAILVSVTGQLLFKLGMMRHPEFSVLNVAGLRRNWPVLAGFGCYGLSTVLYLQVLAKLELSVAYPTASLAYVLVIVMSRLLFKEIVSPRRWLAVVIICGGVVLVGLG